MSRWRRWVCLLLAVCAVLTVAMPSCRRQEERDARSWLSSGTGRTVGPRGKGVVAAGVGRWLRRQVENLYRRVRRRPGVWLPLLVLGALGALALLVGALRGSKPDPYVAAGRALAREGKLEEACEVFAQAVRASPRNDEAHINLAYALVGLGRHEEACESFAEALKIDPRDVGLYADWACALAELGRYGEACEKLRRADDLGVSFVVDERQVPLGLGWKEIAQCQEAIEADPQASAPYLRWGIVLASLGRHDEACEKYAEAARIDPQNVEVHTAWGAALAALGRDAEACEQYAKAVEIAPHDAAAHLRWGEALARMGDRDAAHEKLRQAVRLSPDLRSQVEEIRKQYLAEE